MRHRDLPPPDTDSVIGDAGCAYEVEREAVIVMIERERRSLPSSLLAMALMAVAVLYLPDARFMFALLALRFASFLVTRSAGARLERLAYQRRPLAGAQRAMALAMALTGVTLGLMLWPQPPETWDVPVTVIQAIVLVAVTLIAVTLAALPLARDAMLASFWLTVCALVILHPDAGDAALIAAYTIPLIGIRLYSASAGRHIDAAAQTLVQKRKLSIDLAKALEEAEYLSWRDPLTQLYNRRKLFEEGRSDGRGLSRHLLTIDLDRFKRINDTFGHATGDRVLVATAEAIRAWMTALPPSGDHEAYRLGGEEFLIAVFGLDDVAMAEEAERLRLSIADLSDRFSNLPGVRISASLGLAEWRLGEPLDDALQRADHACYAAKHGGRNRVRRAA